MDFLMAFLAAAAVTLVIGIGGRYVAGLFSIHSRPGPLAFCLALGFALGQYSHDGPINRDTMLALAAAGGAAAALLMLWWVLVRPTVEQPY